MHTHPLAATAICLFAAALFLYAMRHRYHLGDRRHDVRQYSVLITGLNFVLPLAVACQLVAALFLLAKNHVIAAQTLTTFRYAQAGETNDDAR